MSNAVTAPTTTYLCSINHRPDHITITGPQGAKSCRLNLCVIDQPAFTLSTVERDLLDSIKMAVKVNADGREEFTYSELKTLAGIRDRANTWTPAAPAPATVVSNAPATPVPVLTPLTSLANHTVTVTVNENPQRKKRQSRTNDTNAFIYEQVRNRSRSTGVDELEFRISRLRDTERRLGQEITLLNYDIPKAVRDVIPEPSNFLWLYGFRMTESVWVFFTEDVKREGMEQLFAYWDTFPSIKYRLTELSAKQADQIRKMASDALCDLLRQTHTSLIEGLGNAAEALEDATKLALTHNDRLTAIRTHDNAVRAKIQSAADALNRAVICAERYDADENTSDLLEGLRSVIAARRDAFNAAVAIRDGKGVNV